MTEDKPIRLRSSADVLSLIPSIVGFAPEESLVLLSIHSSGTASALRVDLPPADEPAAIPTITGLAARVTGVRTVIIAGFTSAPWDQAAATRALIGELARALHASGIPIHDALLQAEDGFGEITARVALPLGLLETPAAARKPEPSPSADAAAQLPYPRPGERESFRRALARARSRSLAGDVLGAPDAAAVTDELLDATAGGGNPSDDDLARWLVCLLDPDSRDVALFTAAWGLLAGREAADEIARIRDAGQSADARMPLSLIGKGGAARPSTRRLETAAALLSRIAAAVSEPHAQAVALTLLAWTWFARGRSSLADRMLAHALSLDADYPLAALLSGLIAATQVPDWAFAAA